MRNTIWLYLISSEHIITILAAMRPKMMARLRLAIQLFACLAAGLAQDTAPVMKTATHHPMQYWLSLPEGWSAQKTWPVVVVIESANREFQQTAAIFTKARGDLPFILITPLVVTNGGPGYRSVPTYHYSEAAWSRIEHDGPFQFDTAGIEAAVADVKNLYHGEGRYFITGWEAGGHTVWAMLFQHPERLRAAAPVSTNYAGRWMDAGTFSTAPERANLPVRVFQVENLPPAFMHQMDVARETAQAHGYKNVTVSVVRGKPHGPLASEVLGYFNSLLIEAKR